MDATDNGTSPYALLEPVDPTIEIDRPQQEMVCRYNSLTCGRQVQILPMSINDSPRSADRIQVDA